MEQAQVQAQVRVRVRVRVQELGSESGSARAVPGAQEPGLAMEQR